MSDKPETKIIRFDQLIHGQIISTKYQGNIIDVVTHDSTGLMTLKMKVQEPAAQDEISALKTSVAMNGVAVFANVTGYMETDTIGYIINKQ